MNCVTLAGCVSDSTGPNVANAANWNTVNIHTAAAGASGSDQDAAEASSVFDNSSLGWKQVQGDIFIPEQFTIEEITHHLTTIQVSLVVQTSIGNGTGSKFHVFQLM